MAGDYSEAIDRTGADALIPVEYARAIIQNLPNNSAALNLFRKVTMSRKQQRLPVLSALATAYWVGGDTGLKQTTREVWEGKFLVAEELATIIPVPQAVLDDSDFNIWQEVRPSMEEAAGALIDAATLFGSGAPASFAPSVVAGCDTAGNWYAHAGSGVDVAEDINQTMAIVEADGYTPNGHAADVTLRATLRGLRSTQKVPIYVTSLEGGQRDAPSVYDLPVHYSNNGQGAFDFSKAQLITGDWNMGVIGIRQDMSYSVHTEGVITDDTGKVILNLMQQDSAAIRLVMRLGFVIANPVTRRATGSASRWPFAYLKAS